MTRRLPKPMTPPRCVTNALTSLTRYTCAGIVCSVDDATPFNTSNSCGESTGLSGGPGRDETIDARQHRPDDGAGKSDTHQRELDRQPHVVDVGLVGNPQQRSGDAESERIEAHHQHDRERGTLHQPGCLLHRTPCLSARSRKTAGPATPNAEIVPPECAAPSNRGRARRAPKSSSGTSTPVAHCRRDPRNPPISGAHLRASGQGSAEPSIHDYSAR